MGETDRQRPKTRDRYLNEETGDRKTRQVCGMLHVWRKGLSLRYGRDVRVKQTKCDAKILKITARQKENESRREKSGIYIKEKRIRGMGKRYTENEKYGKRQSDAQVK